MRLTKQQFIDRFTSQEMQAIMAAGRASVGVEAWLFRFNNLTPDPDGTSVDLQDPRTLMGLQELEAGGLLGPGRAAEICAEVVEVVEVVEPTPAAPKGATVYKIGENFMTAFEGEAGPDTFDASWPVSPFYAQMIVDGATLEVHDGKLVVRGVVL